MSKVVKLEEIGKDYKEISELKEQCVQLYKAIDTYKAEIDRLKAELNSTTIQQVQFIKEEEAIVLAQIRMMKDRAMLQPLSLEEVKRLDLLIKNLYLIRGEATNIIDQPKKKKQLSNSQLLELASSLTEDEQSERK